VVFSLPDGFSPVWRPRSAIACARRVRDNATYLMSKLPRDPSDDEAPGVPIFRTWRGVYLFVAACFAAMVIALTVFTRFYA